MLKELEPPAWKELPRKPPPLETFLTEESPFAATISSVSMELPVWPTLIPRLDIKLSIFWLILRKATAQRNQMSIFPAAVSLPTDSTSASVRAKTVIGCVSSRLPDSRIVVRRHLFFLVYTFHSQLPDILRQWRCLQYHPPADCLYIPINLFVFRKVDGKPSGNAVLDPGNFLLGLEA